MGGFLQVLAEMLKRRLILLFVLAMFVALILAVRLYQLQVVQARMWKDRARSFSYRHLVIPSIRGAIVDRKGRYLAVEQPCNNLAIDYQAMNCDYLWITRQAIDELRADHLTRSQIIARLPATRKQIAARLLRLPAAIAHHCHLPLAKVLETFDTIRKRMAFLRQDIWTLRYGHDSNVRADVSPADRQQDVDLALTQGLNLLEAHEAHTVVPDIPDQVAFYFQKHSRRYPGLVVVPSQHRVYPFGSVAAQVIGAMRQVTPAALRKNPFVLPRLVPGSLRDTRGQLKGYLPGDNMGAFGVEYAAENLLRPTRGVELVRLDGKQVPQDYRAPIPGQTVRLTLDIQLQQQLQRLMLNPQSHLLYFHGIMHRAAVVVMSVRTNRVLVMLSLPTYNLNKYHQDFSQFLADTQLPLMNRAISSAYPPGSIVKPLEAAYALTVGVIQPNTVMNCGACLLPGHPNIFRNWTYPAAPGPLNMVQALEQSCDTYFYRVGMKLGLKRLVEGYRAFGLGSATGIGLHEETSGYLPPVQPDRSQFRITDWAIMMGIGQGPMAVTPLQMANAYTAMLRGGVWMQPQIIEQLHRPPPRLLHLNVPALSSVHQGMYLVVHGPNGTAPLLRMGLPVAGKTGTAQTAERIDINGKITIKKGDDAWFVGYVPANKPKYVLVAIVEMGGDGGRRAGPIVKTCIQLMQQRGYLPQAATP